MARVTAIAIAWIKDFKTLPSTRRLAKNSPVRVSLVKVQAEAR